MFDLLFANAFSLDESKFCCFVRVEAYLILESHSSSSLTGLEVTLLLKQAISYPWTFTAHDWWEEKRDYGSV